ncbi:unnamed protein product [Tetraodon nigroviridis]|uniref:Chromosome 4 SCAF15093, whole genome shotgun sequence n=1 Tax=Tetraodon nigroviridis TaxID=99883 RepID=Q4RGS0_TETNG|nr:unnamed protein product [Tetraodon nigroviridis]
MKLVAFGCSEPLINTVGECRDFKDAEVLREHSILSSTSLVTFCHASGFRPLGGVFGPQVESGSEPKDESQMKFYTEQHRGRRRNKGQAKQPIYNTIGGNKTVCERLLCRGSFYHPVLSLDFPHKANRCRFSGSSFVVSMGSFLDVSNWLNPAKLTLYSQTNSSAQWTQDLCGQRTTEPCEQICEQDTGQCSCHEGYSPDPVHKHLCVRSDWGRNEGPWPYTNLEKGYDLVTGEQAPERIFRQQKQHVTVTISAQLPVGTSNPFCLGTLWFDNTLALRWCLRRSFYSLGQGLWLPVSKSFVVPPVELSINPIASCKTDVLVTEDPGEVSGWLKAFESHDGDLNLLVLKETVTSQNANQLIHLCTSECLEEEAMMSTYFETVEDLLASFGPVRDCSKDNGGCKKNFKCVSDRQLESSGCMCPAGLRPMKDGSGCYDNSRGIDCTDGFNGGCEQLCLQQLVALEDDPSSSNVLMFCGCVQEYRLAQDGRSCLLQSDNCEGPKCPRLGVHFNDTLFGEMLHGYSNKTQQVNLGQIFQMTFR